jgi:serine/threonine protein kinase
MGVVFLADHQRIERRFAIKLLAPELARDPHALQRFFNEARATSRMRHPGIVDVFDCDVDATGRAYMVMEHLEGETLAERLRRAEKLHWSAACLIARRVADALGAVHDKGIVHRDLKPENVFLVNNGRDPAATVKVLDFGLAKLLTADAVARLTMRGMLVGTPDYMSPEQCAGAEVDHRADIYALGCILFEMLTGHPPFVASTVRAMVVAHRFRPVPSVGTECSDLPEWLGDLLARMLAKEPNCRPPSMREVSKALCQYKTQRWTTVTTTVRAAERRDHRETEQARSSRRLKLLPRAWSALRGGAAAVAKRLRVRRTGATIGLAAILVFAAAIWSGQRKVVVQPSESIAGTVLTRQPAPPPSILVRSPALTNTTLKVAAELLVPAAAVPAAQPLPSKRKPDQPVRPGRRTRLPVIEPRRALDSDGVVDL